MSPDAETIRTQTIRTVVFDLDGTLVETLPDIATAMNAVLTGEGRRALTLDEIRPLIGGGARALIADAFAVAGGTIDEAADRARIDAAFARFLALYEARPADESHVFPGVFEALESLSERGCTLCVCTNKPERLTHMVLEAMGLDRFFSGVVAGDTLDVKKPAAAPVFEAMARAGAGPGRAVMVGDSPTDAGAARAAGLAFIAVSFGYSRVPAADLGADILIDHFDRLRFAIDSLSTR